LNYELKIKKNNKRIVLRVKGGAIIVSAPPRVPKGKIDEFVHSKTSWIEKQLAKPPAPPVEFKEFDDALCLEKFKKIADNIYPLVSKKVKPQPTLQIKNYKSRWGVCYHKRGYIILNKQLFDKPIPAIEYVILHEYLHFLVQNHGKKFYKLLSELMPDYKERRKLLKNRP